MAETPKKPFNTQTLMIFLIALSAGLIIANIQQARRKADKPEQKQGTEYVKKPEKTAIEKTEKAEVKDANGKKNTPASVMEAVVSKYKEIPAYDVKFFLQHPRTKKDADNPEQMERLRETYILAYKRNDGGDPKQDTFRLEGIYGNSKCAIVSYSQANKGFLVFHPGKRKQKLPKSDPRLQDLFGMGFLTIATNLSKMMDGKDSEVTMEPETMKRTPDDKKPTQYYSISLKSNPGVNTLKKTIVFINKKTYDIEIMESYDGNPRAKTESTRYTLKSRQTWFDFEPNPRDTSDARYSQAPDYKNHACTR